MLLYSSLDQARTRALSLAFCPFCRHHGWYCCNRCCADAQRQCQLDPPAWAPTNHPEPPPSADDIMNMIQKGELDVHPSRGDTHRRELVSQRCNIQRARGVPGGDQGGWNQACWDHLKKWLMSIKRLRTLPAPVALLALPAPPAPSPTIHGSPSSSSSDSSSSESAGTVDEAADLPPDLDDISRTELLETVTTLETDLHTTDEQ